MQLLSKEPDMIAFIEDYVNDGDIYYDIGANIGVFSMYSAIKKMLRYLPLKLKVQMFLF